MADLDIGLLRSFSTAAAEGSFSAAARRLNCTQGTISQRLKLLEERVGGPLFHRNYHQLVLTPIGNRLLPMARRLLRFHDEMKLSVRPSTPRTVRIGIAEDYAGARLASILDFQSDNDPTRELGIVCGLSGDLMRMVDAGDLDIAVVTPHDGYQHGELITKRQLVWACSDGFSMPQDGAVPLAVYPEGCNFRQNAIDTLEQAGWPWRVVMSSASARGVLAAVEAGLALAIVAEGIVPPQLRLTDPAWGLPMLGRAEIRMVRRKNAPDWLDDIAAVLVSTYREN